MAGVVVTQEEVDEAGEEAYHRHRQKYQQKKIRVYDESGLTDADRRETRVRQRTLQDSMKSGEIGWAEGRISNNEIFGRKVAYAREMVIDVENSGIAMHGFAKEVERTVAVPRFDAFHLVDKLSKKCSSQPNRFDWTLLGSQIGVCFSATPIGLSFLAGALDSKPRQRAKPKPRVKRSRQEENVQETRPENVTNKTSSADKLSAMEKLLKKVEKRLSARTEEESQKHKDAPTPTTLDAVQFLFNPRSFTQTVENIFTYSFLVKKGTAGIGVQEVSNNGGELSSLFVHKTDRDNAPKERQSVCSFTMADFRRLTRNVETSDLPHRSSSSSTSNNHTEHHTEE